MGAFLNRSDEILEPERHGFGPRSMDPEQIRTIGITSPYERSGALDRNQFSSSLLGELVLTAPLLERRSGRGCDSEAGTV